jgi:hypothetical protein
VLWGEGSLEADQAASQLAQVMRFEALQQPERDNGMPCVGKRLAYYAWCIQWPQPCLRSSGGT